MAGIVIVVATEGAVMVASVEVLTEERITSKVIFAIRIIKGPLINKGITVDALASLAAMEVSLATVVASAVDTEASAEVSAVAEVVPVVASLRVMAGVVVMGEVVKSAIEDSINKLGRSKQKNIFLNAPPVHSFEGKIVDVKSTPALLFKGGRTKCQQKNEINDAKPTGKPVGFLVVAKYFLW